MVGRSEKKKLEVKSEMNEGALPKEVVTLPKKKKGRPKKIQVVPVETANLDKNVKKVKEQESISMPSPKEPESLETEKELDYSPSEQPNTGRPGRKSKTSLSLEKSALNRTKTRVGSLSPATGKESPLSESSNDSIPSKGRGRPKLSLPDNEIDNHSKRQISTNNSKLEDTVEQRIENSQLSKGPGRKRKIDSESSPGELLQPSKAIKRKKKHFKGLRYSFGLKKKAKPKPKNMKSTGAQDSESVISEEVDIDSLDSSSIDTQSITNQSVEPDTYDGTEDFDDTQDDSTKIDDIDGKYAEESMDYIEDQETWSNYEGYQENNENISTDINKTTLDKQSELQEKPLSKEELEEETNNDNEVEEEINGAKQVNNEAEQENIEVEEQVNIEAEGQVNIEAEESNNEAEEEMNNSIESGVNNIEEEIDSKIPSVNDINQEFREQESEDAENQILGEENVDYEVSEEQYLDGEEQGDFEEGSEYIMGTLDNEEQGDASYEYDQDDAEEQTEYSQDDKTDYEQEGQIVYEQVEQAEYEQEDQAEYEQEEQADYEQEEEVDYEPEEQGEYEQEDQAGYEQEDQTEYERESQTECEQGEQVEYDNEDQTEQEQEQDDCEQEEYNNDQAEYEQEEQAEYDIDQTDYEQEEQAQTDYEQEEQAQTDYEQEEQAQTDYEQEEQAQTDHEQEEQEEQADYEHDGQAVYEQEEQAEYEQEDQAEYEQEEQAEYEQEEQAEYEQEEQAEYDQEEQAEYDQEEHTEYEQEEQTEIEQEEQMEYEQGEEEYMVNGDSVSAHTPEYTEQEHQEYIVERDPDKLYNDQENLEYEENQEQIYENEQMHDIEEKTVETYTAENVPTEPVKVPGRRGGYYPRKKKKRGRAKKAICVDHLNPYIKKRKYENKSPQKTKKQRIEESLAAYSDMQQNLNDPNCYNEQDANGVDSEMKSYELEDPSYEDVKYMHPSLEGNIVNGEEYSTDNSETADMKEINKFEGFSIKRSAKKCRTTVLSEDKENFRKNKKNAHGCNVITLAARRDGRGIPKIAEEIDQDVANPEIKRVLCKCRVKLNPQAVNMTGEIYCQAYDCLDGKMIGCCNIVSDDVYIRVSPKIPFMLLCNIHRQRLRRHNCCPGCGLFCTQGVFNECHWDSSGIRHYYHKLCGLVIKGETLCPHCGSNEQPLEVHIELKLSRKPIIYLKQHQEKKGLVSSARMVFNTIKPGSPEVPEDNEPPKVDYVTLPNGKFITPSTMPMDLNKHKLDEAIKALNSGKAINCKLTSKAIYWACKYDDLEKLLYVLVNGLNPDVKVKEYGSQTGLHTSAMYGSLSSAHILVLAGAALDLTDSQLLTPLLVAITRDNNEIVNYLIQSGCNLNARTGDAMTCLHLASKGGNYDACKHILNSGRLSRHALNAQDEGGWTPLVWASENRCINIVKLLLDRGADPQICDVEQNTALHWAAFSGSTHICSMMLEKGCSLRSMNGIGDTPLHIAARQNHVEVVSQLLARGADICTRNKRSQTPLECCLPETPCHLQITLCKKLQDVMANNGIRTEKIICSDIACGKESVPITCVNGVNDENLPKNYIYIAENCEAHNVNIDRTINTLKFCDCTDGCISDNCECSQLNFQCWYDPEGKLLNDFNFLDPPMIFECNRACACNKLSCHNRVVQHGITAHLQLIMTEGKGWGVRALKEIPKGSYVCEYVGEIITDLEADQREDDSYLFDLDNRDTETYCIDARQYANVARFINHLCEPNLTPVKVFIDHQDLVFPRIAFFANRTIEADEELGFDYGEKFWVIKYKQFTCDCGLHNCKYSSAKIQETLDAYNAKIKAIQEANEAAQNGEQ